MDTPTSDEEVQNTSDAPGDDQKKATPSATRTPSIIVGTVAAVVVALSVFYLLRPEPLLVQGEVDATRLDIAARVDGRVKEIPVERGQNVPAGAVLVRIDNPETVAKLGQMKAAMAVAEAQLANVLGGTRAETIAAFSLGSKSAASPRPAQPLVPLTASKLVVRSTPPRASYCCRYWLTWNVRQVGGERTTGAA